MAALSTIAAIATIASAGLGLVSARKQQKAAKRERQAQEKAARIQNKQARREQAVQVRRSLAAARVQRAELQALGFSRGLGQGSSVVQGAVGGVGTDVASAVGRGGIAFGTEQARVGALNAGASAAGSLRESAMGLAGLSSLTGVFSDEQTLAGIKGLFT